MIDKITLSPSHIPIIMGDNAERKADLFLIKTGLMERPKPTEAMLWGRRLEPLVLDFMQDAGSYDKAHQYIREEWNDQPCLTHPEHDWFYGYADDLTVNNGGLEIVEVKTTARPITLSDDNIPDAWRLQCQAMLAMGAWDGEKAHKPKRCLLACLSMGSRYSEVKIQPDRKCQKAIVEAAAAFRQAIINNDMGQFELTSSQLNHAFPPSPDKTVKTSVKVDTAIDDYKNLNLKIKEHTGHKELLTRKIKAHMKDAELLMNEDGDKVLATWKLTKTGSRMLRIK